MDFQNLTLSSWKRNQFLVCPDGYCSANPHMVSPNFELPVEALKKRWMIMIAAEPRIENRRAGDDPMQYDFIQRTKFLRFPDINKSKPSKYKSLILVDDKGFILV